MKASAIATMPTYFDRYINLVPEIGLIDALTQYGEGYLESKVTQIMALGMQVYAPGKWTVNEILQHLTDTERVFAYRALGIARNDKTHFPSFDENLYAEYSGANDRYTSDILEEFYSVRKSTILFFKSLNPDALMREGITSNSNNSVLAIGFTIVGHVIHHMNVLEDRYFPMIH